jgi:hypothetical protein
MVMITLIPASAASIIASAAKAGGTKIMVVSAPACRTASFTVLKTGRSKWVVPPFPECNTTYNIGSVVPSLQSFEKHFWKVPSLPFDNHVNP